MDVKSGKANLFIQAQQANLTEDNLTEAKKTSEPLASTVAATAEKKAPIRSGATAKTEIQLSASATQAQLSNRLNQTLKTDFAQKKTNNPVLQNITTDHGTETRGGKTIELTQNFPWFKFKFGHVWNDKSVKHVIPKTLSTGNGDDKVDIQMGNDGRIHVKVNDKEAWSGTPEQFNYLTIDTGGGKDVVTNTVDGAYIRTGEGLDIVTNQASGTTIDTGGGDDEVYSTGSHNIIGTGSGQDHIESDGDSNEIRTGDNNDGVYTKGEGNKVWTGQGVDSIVNSGDNNQLSGGGDKDFITSQGHNNEVWAGDGYDQIYVDGNRNHIYGEDDPDNINVKGSNNVIDGGIGEDTIRSKGDENKIYGGADADTIFNAGDRNLINPGAGRDKVSESGPFFFGNDPSQVGTNTTFEATDEEVREELTAPFDDLLK